MDLGAIEFTFSEFLAVSRVDRVVQGLLHQLKYLSKAVLVESLVRTEVSL